MTQSLNHSRAFSSLLSSPPLTTSPTDTARGCGVTLSTDTISQTPKWGVSLERRETLHVGFLVRNGIMLYSLWNNHQKHRNKNNYYSTLQYTKCKLLNLNLIVLMLCYVSFSLEISKNMYLIKIYLEFTANKNKTRNRRVTKEPPNVPATAFYFLRILLKSISPSNCFSSLL